MRSINEFGPQQILFITDIEEIVGKRRLTLRRWWMSGRFPPPARLNGRTLAWRRDVIESWINQSTRINDEYWPG